MTKETKFQNLFANVPKRLTRSPTRDREYEDNRMLL